MGFLEFELYINFKYCVTKNKKIRIILLRNIATTNILRGEFVNWVSARVRHTYSTWDVLF